MSTVFAKPFRLGGLEIKNRALLAPLAGVSDVPFRRICQELGAGLTYVEMISSTAINHAKVRTLDLTRRHESEDQLGFQLTGPNAESVADASEEIERRGFETIDVNMGCPVRKIVNKGWGSAILKEPQRVQDTIAHMRERVSVPVTAKIRLGFTENDLNVVEVCRRLAVADAEMITIHGRLRGEDYGAPVRYDKISEGFAAAKSIKPDVFTMGNGNVFDYASAMEMVNKTGCDAVLVSRGALGNPWIFGQIVRGDEVHPTVDEWAEVLFRHMDYHETFYGVSVPTTARFRKHLLWYVSGFPHTRQLRPVLSQVKTMDEVRRIIEELVAGFPGDLPRNASAPEANRRIRAMHDPKYEMDRQLDRGFQPES